MFKKGDTVVHPEHGAAVVEGVEERAILGERRSYLRLRVAYGDLTLLVPIDSLTEVGLRGVIPKAEGKRVLDSMHPQGVESILESPATWHRRFKANLEKLRSGNVLLVAEVVRELFIREGRKGLDAGEQRMLVKARQILVSELMVSLGITEEETAELINRVLSGPSTGTSKPESHGGTRYRDDFTEATKRVIAARAAYRCSNPGCQAQTSGPQSHPAKTVNLGVAAHITAAAPGGPRYDPAISPAQRRGSGNGVWLCQTCAKLVDSDTERFRTEVLRHWKNTAEKRARALLGKADLTRPVPVHPLTTQTQTRPIQASADQPLTDERLLRMLGEAMAELRLILKRTEATLALADIDAQTVINRRFGRQVGDHVIATVGGLLRDATGSRFVGRWGADSFYAVLEDLDANDGVDVMNLFCEAVHSFEWERLAPELRVTCSAGIAQWKPGERLVAWINRAVYGVKVAKRDGGGCVKIGPLYLLDGDDSRLGPLSIS